ncbi:MAG: hypothetical protein LBV41_11080 [Cytophagaceae bacterium]|jgi:hypothetical protein|nr:hypothetical protein [Cytophagaceae bacterium]
MKQIFLSDNLKREMLAIKWDVKPGERRTISSRMLWGALNFSINSGLARTLRAAAMQRGGVMYDSEASDERNGYHPDCELVNDKKNKVMQFFFKKKVILTLHGCNNLAVIESALGREEFQDIKTIKQLMDLQFAAECIFVGTLINEKKAIRAARCLMAVK